MNVLASEAKSRRPETITAENQYACHDLSVWNKRQKSHLNHLEQKKLIGKSNILARGKSCVLPTDPFFTLAIDYIPIYSSDR